MEETKQLKAKWVSWEFKVEVNLASYRARMCKIHEFHPLMVTTKTMAFTWTFFSSNSNSMTQCFIPPISNFSHLRLYVECVCVSMYANKPHLLIHITSILSFFSFVWATFTYAELWVLIAIGGFSSSSSSAWS